jgi:septum formation protein
LAVQIILASQSPRRKDLLERMGFSVKVVPAQIDESQMEGELVENFVKRVAREKVLGVVGRLQTTLYPTDAAGQPLPTAAGGRRHIETRWVIGADTVVVQNNKVMGKPADTAEAVETLARLSGKRHRVLTGFCIHDLKKNKEGVQAVSTEVLFKELSSAEIDKYISVGESMDKAGSYAIQGVGAYMVDSIVGSYTNVIGLPMCQVIEMMEEMGATDLLPY